MARAPKSYRVTIANTKQVVDCADDQTILLAAIAAGINYSYACATGNCGNCISHLDTGKVALLVGKATSLTPEQARAGQGRPGQGRPGQGRPGQMLPCRAQPRSDVAIT